MSVVVDSVNSMSNPTPVSLDEWQRVVVALPQSDSALVIGAPGTGKTTALVERVASLVLDDGWSPDDVLVLSPNRLRAAELRDRIALRLDMTSSGPIARTASSVAFQIVQSAEPVPVTLLTGAEHDAFLAELLAGEIADDTDGYWPSSLSRELRQLHGFRNELREFMMRLEEFGCSAQQLRAFGHAHERAEWIAVAEFAARSLGPKAAAHTHQFDAAELVAYAAKLVSVGDPHLALGNVRAVLVDDVQDATESTTSLLRAWASRGVSVIAFGDPDVATSGFRGGRADLCGEFESELGLPQAKRLFLQHRYRTPPRLRDEIARVVSAIGVRVAHEQRDVVAAQAPDSAEPDSAITRLWSPSAWTEARSIAEELRTRHIIGGVPWSSLAVVARSTAQVRSLESALGRLGVPTKRSTSKIIMKDERAASWLLDAAALAYALATSNAVAENVVREQLWALLATPLGGFDAIDLRKLKLALRSAGLDIAAAFAHPVQLELIATPQTRRAAAVATHLAEATRIAEVGSIEDVLWALWSTSQTAQTWLSQIHDSGTLADEANAALDAAVALFASARRFVERRPTESGTVFVAEQRGASIPEDLVVGVRSHQTVTVATPSDLVGCEFDTVVIATLNDGIWPNLRPRFSLLHQDALVAAVRNTAHFDDPQSVRAEVRSDEYRLFVLALSRASARVVLSAHAQDDAQPSVLFGDVDSRVFTPRRPTRLRDLVAELRRELIAAIERDQTERIAPTAAALNLLAKANAPGANPDHWYGIAERSTISAIYSNTDDLHQKRVSPSSIEKIEESSLAWFVDTFAPAPPGDAQATGTIVHAALEELGGDAHATADDFAALVLPELRALPVEAEWMRALTERKVRKMLELVCSYLRTAAADGRTLVGAEAKFTLSEDSFTISGVIDRVERTSDGSYYVVDLKTGSSAVSVTEAKTNAQMECYQLAVFDGKVEHISPGTVAGAALLYVGTGSAGPTLRLQDGLDATRADAVRERIRAAASAMEGPVYSDFIDVEDRGKTSSRRYRIQVIPGVCAP